MILYKDYGHHPLALCVFVTATVEVIHWNFTNFQDRIKPHDFDRNKIYQNLNI